jgi:hypothetical protein
MRRVVLASAALGAALAIGACSLLTTLEAPTGPHDGGVDAGKRDGGGTTGQETGDGHTTNDGGAEAGPCVATVLADFGADSGVTSLWVDNSENVFVTTTLDGGVYEILAGVDAAPRPVARGLYDINRIIGYALKRGNNYIDYVYVAAARDGGGGMFVLSDGGVTNFFDEQSTGFDGGESHGLGMALQGDSSGGPTSIVWTNCRGTKEGNGCAKDAGSEVYVSELTASLNHASTTSLVADVPASEGSAHDILVYGRSAYFTTSLQATYAVSLDGGAPRSFATCAGIFGLDPTTPRLFVSTTQVCDPNTNVFIDYILVAAPDAGEQPFVPPLSPDLVSPQSLAVARSYLYWSNGVTGMGSIGRKALDGDTAPSNFCGGDGGAKQIFATPTALYWTTDRSVLRAPLLP